MRGLAARRRLIRGRRLPQRQAGPRPHGRPPPARRYPVADSARIASHDTDAGALAGGAFGGGIHVGIVGAAHTARRRAWVFQIVRLPACWGPCPQSGSEARAGVGWPAGRNTMYDRLEGGRIESQGQRQQSSASTNGQRYSSFMVSPKRPAWTGHESYRHGARWAQYSAWQPAGESGPLCPPRASPHGARRPWP